MTLQQWFNESDDTDNLGEHISDQWTGIDEDDNSVDINTVTSGSRKRMLWECSKGHQWYATINARTSKKSGCKCCYDHERKLGLHTQKVSVDRSLYTWCMNNDYGQLILQEWTGKTIDGNEIDIKHTSIQSNKDVYWICSKNSNNRWHTKIQKRTLLYSGCPYCSGHKVDEVNKLYNYAISNNLEYLIEQFVGIDEAGNKVDIKEISRSSLQKVKWKHTVNNEEHEWFARVSDRTHKHSMCPYCNSKHIVRRGKNDLLTWCKNNGDLGDKVIAAWTGLDEQLNKVELDNVSYGSHKKVLLQCECGRIFPRGVLLITHHRSISCKECASKNREIKRYNAVINSSKTLAEWCKTNNIFGDKIREEFVGMDEKGNEVDIAKVTYGSTRKVMWRHYTSSGEAHTWSATIHNRVCNKSLCPICNNRGTSLPEQIIYKYIKQIYPDTISRGKFQGYEFDITIPGLKTCIEYGSTYYHEGKQERDKEKQQLCEKHRVRLIQIIDDSNNELEEKWGSNLIITKVTSNRFQHISKIVQHLCQTLNISYNNINFEVAVNEAIKVMSS